MTAAALLAAAASAALAPAAVADGSGGASASAGPTVGAIACRSACAGGGAKPGGLLRIYGAGLDRTGRVVFLGATGRADDVAAPAIRPRAGRVDVRVPAGAVTGPIVVAGPDGASKPTRPYWISSPVPVVISAPSLAPLVPPAPAHGRYVDAQLNGSQIVFASTQRAQLGYVLTGADAALVAVDLVRVADGAPVASWPATLVAPGVPQTVTWNGLAAGRTIPIAGRYAFRVFAPAPGGSASAAQAVAPDAVQPFDFVPTVFPVQGRHSYGDGAGRFGASRRGYMHQGQDVFAACGTPLVAAQGGVVKFQGFHSRAGNYLVVNPDGVGPDMVYMHLRDVALVPRGARVATGQAIGYVGRTGDASACHLHFELWTAPGWYSGGHPYDPLPSLRSWDPAVTAASRKKP